MKKKSLILISLAVILSACSREEAEIPSAPQTQESITESNIVPGTAIVRFSESVADALNSDEYKEAAEALGIISAERLFPDGGKFEARHRAEGLHLWYKITYDKSVSVTKAGSEISSIPGVESVEFPKKKKTMSFNYFNDPYSRYQWQYYNDGTLGSAFKSGCDIDVLPVWKKYTGGTSNVIVAVIDEGVQLNHPDLQGVCLPIGEGGSRNFVYNAKSDVIQADFHGTHVAGTIAAINNNNVGVCGVAGGTDGTGGVRIMSCAIMASDPNDEDNEYQGDDAAAFVWAADNGAVIANNSWGYGYDNDSDAAAGAKQFENGNSSTKKAIDYFIKYAGYDEDGNQTGPMAGGVVFFAAGNEAISHAVPAEYSKVVAVGALGPDNSLATYSQYGDWVDILAPGGANVNDSYQWILSCSNESGYAFAAGTSMACPHVSGVAALLVSYYGGPGFTNEDLKEKLLWSAKSGANTRGRTIGGGILDALAAFEYNGHSPISISTEYDGNYIFKSHESAEIDYTVTGNEDGKLAVTFETDCPGITGTCTSTSVKMSIDALEADPGAYTATIYVGKGTKFQAVKTVPVTILENHAPKAVSAVPNQIVNAASGGTCTVDLAPYFTDEDGETPKYTAVEGDNTIIAVNVASSNLVIRSKGYGATTVTVVASDARGAKCSQTFDVLCRDTSKSVDIYPNPVKDWLYVRSGEDARAKVTITNLQGSKVYEDTKDSGPFSPIAVKVKDLDAGRYKVKVVVNGVETDQTIVKY